MSDVPGRDELVPAPPVALSVREALERDPLALYLATLRSAHSRRSLTSALTCLVRIFDAIDGGGDPGLSQRVAADYAWGARGALAYAKVSPAIAIVAEDRAPMAALACSALRGVARQAFNLGLLSVEERLRIDDIEAPSLAGRETRGQRLSLEQVAQIAAACARDTTPRGRRDAAILAVMIGAGLRRFEAAALDVEDVRIPRDRAAAVQLTIRSGKGKKFAVAPAPPDVGPVLAAWLRVRRGGPTGALFHASPGRGRDLAPASRLSPAGVYLVCSERGAEAEVPFTPHDLRRTFVTTFLERTGDLAQAQKAARHARPETTVRYDKRGDEALLRSFAEAATGF